MAEIPNAHPGAPLTVWLRANPHDRGYQAVLGPAPDAIEYVRKDVCDACLERAVNGPREELWLRWLREQQRAGLTPHEVVVAHFAWHDGWAAREKTPEERTETPLIGAYGPRCTS